FNHGRSACRSPRILQQGARSNMVVVKEKTTVTQRIHGDCPTHSRTEIAVRDVRTIIDEPKERDGTNKGPTPTETMVAALIACTNVISHKCASKHGVEFKAMAIDAESTFDRRGTQLAEEIEVPFPKIRLVINVTTNASAADLEKVKADLRGRKRQPRKKWPLRMPLVTCTMLAAKRVAYEPRSPRTRPEVEA